MRLQVYAVFTLKDKPKEYLGLRQESWNFGKDRPASMAELAVSFLMVLFDWHAKWLSFEEANYEKQRIEAWLRKSVFVEREEIHANEVT